MALGCSALAVVAQRKGIERRMSAFRLELVMPPSLTLDRRFRRSPPAAADGSALAL